MPGKSHSEKHVLFGGNCLTRTSKARHSISLGENCLLTASARGLARSPLHARNDHATASFKVARFSLSGDCRVGIPLQASTEYLIVYNTLSKLAHF